GVRGLDDAAHRGLGGPPGRGLGVREEGEAGLPGEVVTASCPELGGRRGATGLPCADGARAGTDLSRVRAARVPAGALLPTLRCPPSLASRTARPRSDDRPGSGVAGFPRSPASPSDPALASAGG